MAPLAPPPKLVWRTRTVLVRDTLLLDSLRREVRTERLANQAIRKKLKTTQAERDHWRELNLRKFWTLIWMGVFALLYVLFKVLASRVRVE